MNFWKAYSVVFLVLYVAGAGQANGAPEWIDVFVSGLGFIGLTGYAFQRPLLRPLVWRVAFWLLLIDNWWGHFRGEESFLVVLVGTLVSIPGFIAVFRYGHSAKHIWQSDVPTVPEVAVKEAL